VLDGMSRLEVNFGRQSDMEEVWVHVEFY
jgi:hypothetical protein